MLGKDYGLAMARETKSVFWVCLLPSQIRISRELSIVVKRFYLEVLRTERERFKKRVTEKCTLESAGYSKGEWQYTTQHENSKVNMSRRGLHVLR